MKKIQALMLAVSVLLMPTCITIAILQPGCSTSAQRKAVNTLFTTGATVDAAYKSYLDLVVSKQLPTNDLPRVSKAYAEFQKAFGAAVTLAANSTNAPLSPELLNASSQALLTIKSAKGTK